MRAVHSQATAEPLHLGTSVIECGSAYLTVQVYNWLTVMSIGGEIDATNADLVRDHVTRRVPDDAALIIDMVETDFIGVDGLRTLFTVNLECLRKDTRWALIASRAVHRLLRIGDREHLVPAVRSATEALHCVRRSNRGRRGKLQLVT
jgi:anti-anti-sigma factor